MPRFPKLIPSKNPNSFSFFPAAALSLRFRFSPLVATKGIRGLYNYLKIIQLEKKGWKLVVLNSKLFKGFMFQICLCSQPVMDYGPPHLKPISGSSKQKHIKFKIRHMSPDNQDSSDTLSPSSSDSSSSDDEFFEVSPRILPKIRANNGGTKLEVCENEEIESSMSSGSTSQSSDITHESQIPQFSPTKSPPLQLMEKNMDFDSNRIPVSVFSKSSTPTEWSSASNDSLFSIRIGESSFAVDHASRIDLDLPKAGELLNCRDVSDSQKDSPNFKGIEPYYNVEKSIDEDVKLEKIRIVAEPINGGLKKDPIVEVSRDSYEGNCHCDQSEICVQPFVKPIKDKSSSCPLCHFHNCWWSLFCCKCLSCSCKWCVWPSCSEIYSSCHCKCPSFSSLCCNCSSWSCCKWSSWSCFNCSCWPSCKCRRSSFAWPCCCCGNCERKSFTCSSPIILTDR